MISMIFVMFFIHITSTLEVVFSVPELIFIALIFGTMFFCLFYVFKYGLSETKYGL